MLIQHDTLNECSASYNKIDSKYAKTSQFTQPTVYLDSFSFYYNKIIILFEQGK